MFEGPSQMLLVLPGFKVLKTYLQKMIFQKCFSPSS
jgi:hypothetical protein